MVLPHCRFAAKWALRLREKIQPFGHNPQSAEGEAPQGSKSRSLSLAGGETLD
jgi:hypothetical protein